jgi:hypothetical protein
MTTDDLDDDGACGTALAAAETQRRLHLLQSSIAETRARAEQNLWMSRDHAAALVDSIAALADAADTAIASAAGTADERQQNLLRAERAWSFLAMIRGQHQDSALGPWLQIADYCVIAAYETLRQRCAQLVAGITLPPPPVTFAEAIASPVVYQRESKVRAPGLAASAILDLPLPVVIYPPHQLQCLWLYSTLYHELGHNFDRALGLTGQLDTALVSTLIASAGERSDDWRSWLREMLADAIGVGLGGEGFAHTLADLLGSLSLLDRPTGGTHPPAIVRLELVAAMLEALAQRGTNASASIAKTIAALRSMKKMALARLADPTPLEKHLKEASHIAGWLITTPLAALGGHALVDVLPDITADAKAAHALAALLRRDGKTSPQASTPETSWRLLPVAAQLAVRALPQATPDALDALQAAADRYRKGLEAPAWVVSPERWSTLATLIPQLDRSIVEEERTGYKRPPLELLRAHERVAFVGATNDQLAAKLEPALAARNGRPWQHIELFFLDGPELAALAAGEGKPAKDLEDAQREALDQLSALMPHWADSWVIYRYARAYYFASYWDHERPGGRIHVSPFIWGQPVKQCPGLDYFWHTDQSQPTREYQAYSDGLERLRSAPDTKRLKSGGDPSP